MAEMRVSEERQRVTGERSRPQSSKQEEGQQVREHKFKFTRSRSMTKESSFVENSFKS